MPTPSTTVDREPAGEHLLGGAEGLLLVEYGDYACAATARAVEVVHALLTTWGPRLRFAYRHFPEPRHPQALVAAEAAEAAAAQGRFWPMHDALLALNGRIDDAALVACAAAAGLSIERFADEVESGIYRERVLADRRRGLDAGVVHAPTFFVGGIRYDGPPRGLHALVGVPDVGAERR
jgi:protein-disulfide isomerase